MPKGKPAWHLVAFALLFRTFTQLAVFQDQSEQHHVWRQHLETKRWLILWLIQVTWKKLLLLFIIDMWLAVCNSSIIHTQCTMPIDENSTCAQWCLPSLFLKNTHFLILFWEKAANTCAWPAFLHSHDDTYNLTIDNGPVL